MKKITLILTALSLITTAAIGQESNSLSSLDYRDHLVFGLKIGANYSNVYDAKGDAFTTDPKFGMASGAFAAIPFGRYLGIQPEVLFSQKGFRASGSILGDTYEFTRTTSYIDVPLFLAFKPVEMFTLLAGPQYSFLIQQNDKYTNGPNSIVQEKQFSNNNLRKNMLCFVGGFDVNFSHIVLSARAGWDVQSNDGDGTSTNPRYKNVWYQATIGYRFHF
ncbi:MAG: hypothetical protein K0Q79_3597 [Flavipsychrobacter sp.]|jgi:hypothetical protein|nr:hypothetical protein [Flavipsychrobacter sp.]